MRWANFFALTPTTRPSRVKNVAHRARKHERLERKIAPARGVKGRRETFFAHARSQEPFLSHFNRAGAMFLSLRMHARHWSNPLGRYFFQGQTKTTDRARLVRRAPEGPEGQAAAPVGGGGAWPGFEPTRSATHQRHRRRRCGGRRRDRRVRAGFEARRRTK